MLLYILSDLHISSEEQKIPEWIIEKVKSCDMILINGDLTSKRVIDELCLFSKCLIVRGNCDTLDLPKTNVFDVNGIKCGQIHGDGVSPRGDLDQLYEIASSLDVDVLFSGHTHNFSVHEYKKKLFINPGSATGSPGLISDKEIETIAKVLFSDEIISVQILSKDEVLVDLKFSKDLFK
jgi:putative phosphoesterase